MNKKIIWEPHCLEIDPTKNIAKWDNQYNDFNEDDGDIETMSPHVSDVTSTPFGFWRINDDLHPLKQFKMYMGHTNFNLTEKKVEAFNKVEGVELLRVISRYRFIVGIGKLFDISVVKNNIERALCDKTNNDISLSRIKNHKITDQINRLMKSAKQFKSWFIFVFPNGNIDFYNNLNTEYDNLLQTYKRISNLIPDSVMLES